ncbi:uncharacterized protein LOC111404774 [Olea europaea var. sylvestris]|uniref:uncharacterized protein LOC111404774 n=1 Tax=Olea europaea var. sylvestris TaxID=158386 RepID=UPI000C1D6585|nr:uncharacterized protein LOC111404774 [Olea europaea var. sylvestris]
MFQGLDCSPIKAVRELGSERREPVRSISGVGIRALRGPFPSRRGLGRTHTSGVPVIVPKINAGRSKYNGVDLESCQLLGLMVYLSIEDDTKDLYLFINSPGGWVIPGVAIYDTMQFVQPDIHTICMVLAASTGSFILVGGEITKRLAFPHAWRQ